jgi:hypothetical protein
MAQPLAIELDCRDGSMSIDVDGRRLVARPLVWREKTNLARFAHLGEAFVSRQLVRLALGAQADEVVGEQARAALAAIARWLYAPEGAASALPLEQQFLANATLTVCQALRLGPADLDARPASEVEALWRIAAENQSAPRSPSADRAGAEPLAHVEAQQEDGMTRIEIVPDPGAAVVPTDADSAWVVEHETSGSREVVPGERVWPVGEPFVGAPASHDGIDRASEDAGEASPRGMSPRGGAQPAVAPSVARDPEMPLAPEAEMAVAPEADVAVWPGAQKPIAPDAENIAPVTRAAIALASHPTEPHTPAHRRGRSEVRFRVLDVDTLFGTPASARDTPAAITAPGSIELEASPVPLSADADDLFDDLCERLERASAELGIDLGM